MLGQVAPLLALDEDAIRYELDTSEEYGRGGLHESFQGVGWKWAGEKRRTPGPGDNEYVHQTALERIRYRGYPTNPAFNLNKLPVWKRNAFEEKFVWQHNGPPSPSPTLPGRTPELCGRLVRWLEGS